MSTQTFASRLLATLKANAARAEARDIKVAKILADREKSNASYADYQEKAEAVRMAKGG